jgi:cell division topological specificity factor
MKFSFFKRSGSAPVARERLQILLAHERIERTQPDLVAKLRKEILAVIGKHVKLDPDMVQVKMEHGSTVSTLEIEIELPNGLQGVIMPGAAA